MTRKRTDVPSLARAGVHGRDRMGSSGRRTWRHRPPRRKPGRAHGPGAGPGRTSQATPASTAPMGQLRTPEPFFFNLISSGSTDESYIEKITENKQLQKKPKREVNYKENSGNRKFTEFSPVKGKKRPRPHAGKLSLHAHLAGMGPLASRSGPKGPAPRRQTPAPPRGRRPWPTQPLC